MSGSDAEAEVDRALLPLEGSSDESDRGSPAEGFRSETVPDGGVLTGNTGTFVRSSLERRRDEAFGRGDSSEDDEDSGLGGTQGRSFGLQLPPADLEEEKEEAGPVVAPTRPAESPDRSRVRPTSWSAKGPPKRSSPTSKGKAKAPSIPPKPEKARRAVGAASQSEGAETGVHWPTNAVHFSMRVTLPEAACASLDISGFAPVILVVGDVGGLLPELSAHMRDLYQSGVVRAALHSDGVVVDSGLATSPCSTLYGRHMGAAAKVSLVGISSAEDARERQAAQRCGQLVVAGTRTPDELAQCRLRVARSLAGPCRTVALLLHGDAADVPLLDLLLYEGIPVLAVPGTGGLADDVHTMRYDTGRALRVDSAPESLRNAVPLPKDVSAAELASCMHAAMVSSAFDDTFFMQRR